MISVGFRVSDKNTLVWIDTGIDNHEVGNVARACKLAREMIARRYPGRTIREYGITGAQQTERGK